MGDSSTFRYTSGSRKFTRTRNSLKKFSFAIPAAASAIDNGYETDEALTVQVKAADEEVYIKPEYLVIKVSGIDTGGTPATALTIRITTDAAGDDTIFPDTQATLSTGVTTATTGVAAYSIGLPFVDTASTATTFYLFIKTDVADPVAIESADLYCIVESF